MKMTILIVLIPILAMVAAIVFQSFRRNLDKHKVFGHKHGESVFSIDQYAHESKLADLNPGYKILVSVLLLVICVASNNLYVCSFIIVFCAFIITVVSGLSIYRYLQLLTIPLIFMITGTIIILLEFSTVPPLHAVADWKVFSFYIYITSNGLNRVLVLWGRAFGAISAMYMMTLTTPSNEIFMILDRLHCPHLITELMNMMYRFIFTMMETQVEMRNAAESRLGFRNYRTALSTFGHIGSNLLVVSFKKANAYYDALESRLYTGKLNFLTTEKKVTWQQIVGAIILFAYLGIVYFVCRS